METEEKYGWEQTKDIWRNRDHRFFYRMLGGLILLGIGILVGLGLFQSQQDRTSYFINVFTSILSTITTVVVIDQFNKHRDQQKADQELKELLILQMGCQNNDLALLALDRIKAKEWHKDGSLKKSILSGANLYKARLEKANLEGADFTEAVLEEANLQSANLEGTSMGNARLVKCNLSYANLCKAGLNKANLSHAFAREVNLQESHLLETQMQGINLQAANLRKAVLTAANLERANLAAIRLQDAGIVNANFQGANLASSHMQRAFMHDANFQGAGLYLARLQEADVHSADFRGANLVEANFEGVLNIDRAKFDERTTLPDKSKWALDTDMFRFTDKTHSNFWRSNNPSSSAYPGKVERGE